MTKEEQMNEHIEMSDDISPEDRLEREILGGMIKHHNILNSLVRINKPQAFEMPQHQAMSYIISKAYEELGGNVPSLQKIGEVAHKCIHDIVTGEASLKAVNGNAPPSEDAFKYLAAGILPDDISTDIGEVWYDYAKHIDNYFCKIIPEKMSPSEEKDLINRGAAKIKHVAMREAVVSGLAEVEKGDYDTFIEAVQKAAHIGATSEIGISYTKNIAERIVKSNLLSKPIPTYYPRLDAMLSGGLRKGELILFAAISGGGKSLLTNNIALNIMLSGRDVAIISLELSEDMIANRTDSIMTRMTPNSTRRHPTMVEEYVYDLEQRWKNIDSNYGFGNLTIRKMKSGTTPNEIRVALEDIAFVNGKVPDVVIIDYLDLMQENNIRKLSAASSTFDKDKAICEDLRELADDMQFSCVSSSQLGRGIFSAIEKTRSEDIEGVDENYNSHMFVQNIAGGISKQNTADFFFAIIPNGGRTYNRQLSAMLEGGNLFDINRAAFPDLLLNYSKDSINEARIAEFGFDPLDYDTKFQMRDSINPLLATALQVPPLKYNKATDLFNAFNFLADNNYNVRTRDPITGEMSMHERIKLHQQKINKQNSFEEFKIICIKSRSSGAVDTTFTMHKDTNSLRIEDFGFGTPDLYNAKILLSEEQKMDEAFRFYRDVEKKAVRDYIDMSDLYNPLPDCCSMTSHDRILNTLRVYPSLSGFGTI